MNTQYGAQILTCANWKGGVGKTTSAVNIAAGAARGFTSAGAPLRVLLVDMDAQASASRSLRVDGWLISRAGFRNDIDAEVMQETLQQTSRYHTFRTRIRTLKAVSRAAGYHCSVFGMAGGGEAVRDFRDFATEWLARIGRAEA